ncbi:BnaC01g42770D [Brassica napus]|uniref:BnaC01g42770D protein n=2 Tax=Brassica TaxID=3705 RepID=A0A078ITU7_BRANA|nr:BnaC01g42770D [Brassica napus]
MFSWGEESGGRLGHGICSSFPYPNFIHEFDGSSVELADCGEFNTCAVIASGELYAWGDGAHNAGLLGIGSETSHWKPVRILGQMEGSSGRTVARGNALIRSSSLETSVPWSKLMVKDVRQLRLNLDTMEASCFELDDWGQLAIRSPQLGRVFRSGPVWPGPSGYRAVPMVRVRRRVHVRSWLNQAMRQRPGGVGFRVGTAWGAVGEVMGAVLSGFGRKGTRGQVASPWPILCNRSARAVTSPSLYKYRPLGSILSIIFPRESPEEIVRQKRKRVAGDLKSNRVWWCLI